MPTTLQRLACLNEEDFVNTIEPIAVVKVRGGKVPMPSEPRQINRLKGFVKDFRQMNCSCIIKPFSIFDIGNIQRTDD